MESSHPNPAIHAVANTLRINAATAEVLRAFAAAGIESLVLKGPAIARWLYSDDDPRYYVDSDLLVRPSDIPGAQECLRLLGFENQFDDSSMPEWWREHGSEWWRASDRVLVDLHRTLPGVGIDPGQAWAVLSSSTEVTTIAGQSAPILGLPARTLHVVLHAGHHGAAWGGPIADLERAIARVELPVWRDAATLAERLEATDALSAGLRLTAPGEALAAALGLPSPRSVGAVLRASSPPPVALGFEQLASARNARERAAIVWRKLLPPASFIRHWQPEGTETRRGLALAYLRRPLWILRHAPAALRSWRAARRHVRHGGS
ncbi:MAG TPA: nucleotidyltransferase family protein [Solirubrobacteraceae bacterium]|nr:nucleotidyltransferase family protein [Solirubrobacteraceae bacterium]